MLVLISCLSYPVPVFWVSVCVLSLSLCLFLCLWCWRSNSCSVTLNVWETAFNNKGFMCPEMKEHKIRALCVRVCLLSESKWIWMKIWPVGELNCLQPITSQYLYSYQGVLGGCGGCYRVLNCLSGHCFVVAKVLLQGHCCVVAKVLRVCSLVVRFDWFVWSFFFNTKQT